VLGKEDFETETPHLNDADEEFIALVAFQRVTLELVFRHAETAEVMTNQKSRVETVGSQAVQIIEKAIGEVAVENPDLYERYVTELGA
jgi:uncharacterized membrane protein